MSGNLVPSPFECSILLDWFLSAASKLKSIPAFPTFSGGFDPGIVEIKARWQSLEQSWSDKLCHKRREATCTARVDLLLLRCPAAKMRGRKVPVEEAGRIRSNGAGRDMKQTLKCEEKIERDKCAMLRDHAVYLCQFWFFFILDRKWQTVKAVLSQWVTGNVLHSTC